ncbi:ABC transporter permease [Solwaraspora sp. WMMA2080]|uniref:ABC transporter permease n=1 Tax=unclassified Solwaraspora TaxID=2627926 RepID=UPI00248C2ABB|nr:MULTISPECIES: ABC transporter permease [unclassified Solwaraspora]WBB99950.1 ABC transporter permease [Solwaraspora sp. WMMA2059]WBC21503.1 ABC transporter permease [Solwaraspora sp. WMMA2080]
MLRTVAIKLALLVPVLFLVSVGTFVLLQLGPGDPAAQVLGNTGTPADYQRIRTEMGLDQPPVQRYLDWLGGVLRGDLGQNLVPPIEDVSDRLLRAFPVNLQLAAMAIVLALLIAVPLAMWSAYRAGGLVDRWISAGTIGVISVPPFLVGLLLLLVFAIHLDWFPLGQWSRPSDDGLGQNLWHAFLPALTLALAEAPVFARLLRGDLVATLQEDFILAAKAKGMPGWHIMLREALRPSSFSLITLAGVSAGRLLGGTIIVEAVFVLPGVGNVIINAAQSNDYKLVQGGVLLIAIIYLLLNLTVDVLYGYLDPRIRRRHA